MLYSRPRSFGGTLTKLALAFPSLLPLLGPFVFGGPLCDPSVCAIGSVADFGFVFFCLGDRDLSPWHFDPFWLMTWSDKNAGTFGKVIARARSGGLTREK